MAQVTSTDAGYRARVTHCPQGHAYEGDNVQWSKTRAGGHVRRCRTCRAAEAHKRNYRGGRKKMTAEERLLSNRDIDPVSGCWRWTGFHTDEGYGVAYFGKLRGAHRLAYETWVGPIPEGLAIDHVRARGCVHRDCINPEHLEPVTTAENNRRVGRGAVPPKSHCVHGHEMTPKNTYERFDAKRGINTRRCKTCISEGQKRKRASK